MLHPPCALDVERTLLPGILVLFYRVLYRISSWSYCMWSSVSTKSSVVQP